MHFVYKLIPPRPTFAAVRTAEERSVMGRPAAYSHQQLEEGRVVAFGPVADPSGIWGLGILDVEVKRALFRQAGAAGRVTAARAC